MTLIRTEPFVPLVSKMPASTGERTDFQATVVSQPEQAQKFHSIESMPLPSGAATGARASCEPRVTLQRDGDRVASIRVECSCGQVIDLACVYQEPAAAPK